MLWSVISVFGIASGNLVRLIKALAELVERHGGRLHVGQSSAASGNGWPENGAQL